MIGSSVGGAQQRMFRHQHAAEIMRARSILVVACVLWLVSGVPIDYLTYGALGTGSLAFVLTVRLATSGFHAIVLALLFRRRLPAPRVANALIASVFPISAFAIMLIATHMGGLLSPYVSVVFVGIMVQVTAASSPWKRGAVLAGTTVDLLQGVDLATLVKRCGAMPAALVVRLGTGAAEGLAEAHRRGVVHRDVKPGNMFVVAPHGEPLRIELLDFGIARVDGTASPFGGADGRAEVSAVEADFERDADRARRSARPCARCRAVASAGERRRSRASAGGDRARVDR